VATGDAPAPQPLQVRVSNVGRGALSWEASSDQPWLTLDSASGGDGATVTISVTPADIPLGQSATATITWSTTGASRAHTVHHTPNVSVNIAASSTRRVDLQELIQENPLLPLCGDLGRAQCDRRRDRAGR
jgi:Viral BACON domain